MTPILSERTIEMLRASLPAVESHRSKIVEGMAASMAAADPARDRSRAARAAIVLVDMLTGQVRRIAAGRGPADGGAIRRHHDRSFIGSKDYARFGDAIAAVMIDAAGNALPKPVGGAWGDAFWAVIGRLKQPDAERLPAAAARDMEVHPLKILA